MAAPFLDCSRAALGAITSLFDFVSPTAAALWNLRWQVKGYHDARGGTATVPELLSRFVAGSGIRGVNLLRACIQTAWDAQLQSLANITLINLVAVYEDWAASVAPELAVGQAKKIRENLQFCAPTLPGEDKIGITAVMSGLATPVCHSLSSEVLPEARKHKKIHPAHLDALLQVYRAYKEYRNCIAHGGGKATSWTVQNHSRAASLPSGLPFPVPDLAACTVGAPVVVSFRGVIGFSDCLQRIIRTVDAEVTAGEPGKDLLLKRWRKGNGRRVVLPADPSRKAARLRLLLRRVHCPIGSAIGAVEQELRSAGLVFP